MENNYLTQSNFFTRSVYNLESEFQKDLIYLIQNKIDFYGNVQSKITISMEDYRIAKGIQRKKDMYSFNKFVEVAEEIKEIGGAFYNKVTGGYTSFNIIDSVSIDENSSDSLTIELAKFGKIFFFKAALEDYLKEILPKGDSLKYSGHTKIEKSAMTLKGYRRKKFFEILSQFKHTGVCKISVKELYQYLGYVTLKNKETDETVRNQMELEFAFLNQDKYEMVYNSPRFSVFERDFLKQSIKAINEDSSKDINNLKLVNKTKTGRTITGLEFHFNALGASLNEKEKVCKKLFEEDLGLDEEQVLYLLKRIGYKEMYGRYQHNIITELEDDKKIHKERSNGRIIHNVPGYLYKFLFPELQKPKETSLPFGLEIPTE